MINRKDDTEQRAIVAILLSLAVYWVWQFFYLPPAPPPRQALPEAVVEVEPEVPLQAIERPAPVAAADVPHAEIDFETSEIRATLSSEGGGLSAVILPDHSGAYDITPIWEYALSLIRGEADERWSPYGETPSAEQVLTEQGSLVAAGSGANFVDGRYTLEERDAALVAQRLTADGLRVTKTYAAGDDGRFVDVIVQFENAGGQAWSGPLWVGMADVFGGKAGRYENVTRPSAVVDGDLKVQKKIEDLEEGPELHQGPVSWFGIGDRYFMAAAIPNSQSWGQTAFARSGGDTAGVFLVRDQSLSPGQVETLNLRVYIGSKELKTLRAIGHDFPEAVDFGIFGFFSNILLWILERFHGLVGSWGLSIILLTFTVKAAFWPLTQKSFKSSRAMQKVQPKIQALKEKYGEDPQKMGEEQMKLFREEGVNPLSGCLPMVVQMPVWFALYSVLLSSADVYHAEFLYLKDLSSTDPLGVLPLIVGVFYFLQQRLTPMSPTMDPTQQKIMRLMPMMFVVFMFAFPSGLNIYILSNTLLTITQMWLINRAYPITEPVATTT